MPFAFVFTSVYILSVYKVLMHFITSPTVGVWSVAWACLSVCLCGRWECRTKLRDMKMTQQVARCKCRA